MRAQTWKAWPHLHQLVCHLCFIQVLICGYNLNVFSGFRIKAKDLPGLWHPILALHHTQCPPRLSSSSSSFPCQPDFPFAFQIKPCIIFASTKHMAPTFKVSVWNLSTVLYTQGKFNKIYCSQPERKVRKPLKRSPSNAVMFFSGTVTASCIFIL